MLAPAVINSTEDWRLSLEMPSVPLLSMSWCQLHRQKYKIAHVKQRLFFMTFDTRCQGQMLAYQVEQLSPRVTKPIPSATLPNSLPSATPYNNWKLHQCRFTQQLLCKSYRYSDRAIVAISSYSLDTPVCQFESQCVFKPHRHPASTSMHGISDLTYPLLSQSRIID